MIKLNIDGKEVKGTEGQTILEIARENSIDIPTLCHDERVKTYGSCGLCVVEIEGWNRMVRSCATAAQDGMIIHTNSEKIQSSRKTTLEMILSDHTGDCRPPCAKACPAEVDCQGYVGLIANGQYQESLALLKEYYPIPASIGLVCPHPCEDACRRKLVEEPIAIANLKSFAACLDLDSDSPYLPKKKPSSGKNAAVIGAGPAGLTAAYFLALAGHKVKVYDAMPEAGGMLRYGIPEYRLPKELLGKEIDLMRQLGVEFIFNTRIPSDISLSELRDTNDAVFIGIGAWTSSRIGCQGEDSPIVVGGIDFLREVGLGRHPDIGEKVAVIGGGNTAMDAARTAVRLGAREVMVLYRRTRAEMPAQDIEIQEAEEEGVIFKFLMAPEEIIHENGSNFIRMQKMQLGEADASGRRRPVPIPGEEEIIPVDTVIGAIGQKVNPAGFDEISLSKWKTLQADEETFITNIEGVFAGGDAVSGPGIAIEAIAQGKKAAENMCSYLDGETLKTASKYMVEKTVDKEDYIDYEKISRIEPGHEKPEERRQDFRLVPHIMSKEQAVAEASRCLECGCADYYECKLIAYAREYEVQPQILKGDKHQIQPIEETPFMIRDMNKCILCGLCVRVCDEVMGATALGLVNRGFDTVIQPEFGLALQEGDCISCGQCAALCPTGALVERTLSKKNIPLEMDKILSSCSYCGMACTQVVHSKGEEVYKIEPDQGGLLCSRGRFGWQIDEKERLRVPLLRKEGHLEESTWEDVSAAVNKLAAGPQNAISVGLSCTNEQAEAAVRLAEGMKTDIPGSFAANVTAHLADIYGQELPVYDINEINHADVIIMLGAFNNNHIPAVLARKAATNGSKLAIISQETSVAGDMACMNICPDKNDTDILKQILAAVMEIDDSLQGFDTFKAELDSVDISEEAREAAGLYLQAQNPLILVDGINISPAGIQLMADLSLMKRTENGVPGNIMVVGHGANARGVWHSGVKKNSDKFVSALKSGSISNLFIINEDPVGTGIIDEDMIQKADTIVLITPFMTATAAEADIVIPCASVLETQGTYTNADGVKCSLQAAYKTEGLKDIQEIIIQLSSSWVPTVQLEKGEIDKQVSVHLYLPEDDILFASQLHSDYALGRFGEKLK